MSGAAKVKQLRQAGWYVRQIAAACGVSTSAVWWWQREDRVPERRQRQLEALAATWMPDTPEGNVA